VNLPQSDQELEAIRRSLRRGKPYGSDAWTTHIADKLGLESTLRPRGRPRQQTRHSQWEQKRRLSLYPRLPATAWAFATSVFSPLASGEHHLRLASR
jgi:hypothetical protein